MELGHRTKQADGLNFHPVSSSVNKERRKRSASLKAPCCRMKYRHKLVSGIFLSDFNEVSPGFH